MRIFNQMSLIVILLVSALPAWGWDHGDNNLTMAMVFGRSQVTLQDIIKTVEKTSEGKVVKVEIEQKCKLFCSKTGLPLIEVDSVKDGTLTEYYVDPVTGKITEQNKSWWSSLDCDAPWRSESFSKIKMTMEQALAAAEQVTGGKAMSARLKERKGLLFYQVQTLSDGNVKAVLVDPENSKVYQATRASHKECF